MAVIEGIVADSDQCLPTSCQYDQDDQENHHDLPDHPEGYAGIGQTGVVRRSVSACERVHRVITVALAFTLVGVVVRRAQQQQLQGILTVDPISDYWAPLPPTDAKLNRIAFGSCSSQDMPLPYWDTLSSLGPDVTILAGDNVYGDCKGDMTCANLDAAYRKLGSHPSFIGARMTLPMVATLDDHDYGLGNAEASNPFKDVAKGMFLDFFNIPVNDERRTQRDGEGVYTSYAWGEEGNRVQIILLDTRYSRSEFVPTNNESSPFVPDFNDVEKRMLSEAQWDWLEEKLSEPANVRFIVSSVQVLTDGSNFECWRMIPRERERLYNLLMPRAVDSCIVIISGDRHKAGFYEHDSEVLHEVTSSSWTHTVPYGAFSSCKNAQECDENDPRRVDNFIRVNNFGTAEIDWEKRELALKIRRAQMDKKFTNRVNTAGEVLISVMYDIP